MKSTFKVIAVLGASVALVPAAKQPKADGGDEGRPSTSQIIQEALHNSMMNEIAAMHEWWCEPEEKDDEPLCLVWDEYHGDTSQVWRKNKVPKGSPKISLAPG